MKEKSTIALVDDERNILTSLGMALEAEGYKVRTYSDGAAAGTPRTVALSVTQAEGTFAAGIKVLNVLNVAPTVDAGAGSGTG